MQTQTGEFLPAAGDGTQTIDALRSPA